MGQSNPDTGNSVHSKQGDFFIIDRRTWKAICDRNDINAAAAWLLLSQGTGGNNLTTSWSVDSIKRYLGMGYPRAKDAIERLLAWRLVRHNTKHTPLKPRYDVVPYAALANRHGNSESSGTEEDDTENLIWLPNSLIRGASGEEPPIRRLRASGDLWALRLFVDLYDAQNLRDDAGISRICIQQKYETKKFSQQGPFNILGFKPLPKAGNWSGPLEAHRDRAATNTESSDLLWRSVELLERLKLLTFVPHLMENSTHQAEIVHPLGIGAYGELPLETEIGQWAQRAAVAISTEWAIANARKSGFTILCPVMNTLPDAQLVGIGRLHYRPHTRRTSEWYRELQNRAQGYIDGFRETVERCTSSDLSFAVNL